MKFVLIDCRYYFNADPVTLVLRNPFGGLTNVDTTQTALQGHVAASSTAPWGDQECLAEATAQLPGKFPDITGITVELYTPPANPAPIVEQSGTTGTTSTGT